LGNSLNDYLLDGTHTMAKRAKKYWLMKSEPSCYSIHDLAAESDQTTHWDGVRNYQARNLMRDEMKIGDGVLFYHSNAKPPAVAGTAKVCCEAYPDFSAWDKNDKHYDAKSSPENPTWQMVDIELDSVFDEAVGLPELREVKSLAKMMLLQRGSRLSVQPVAKAEFDTIVKLAKKKAANA
jgi:predicted RNA-binding protein with PUA-like domain